MDIDIFGIAPMLSANPSSSTSCVGAGCALIIRAEQLVNIKDRYFDELLLRRRIDDYTTESTPSSASYMRFD